MTQPENRNHSPLVSLGIFAWNEERALRPMLESLFQQSFFSRFSARPAHCEILCVANGCSDGTAAVAREIFQAQTRSHPHARCFSTQVAELPQRGKVNAWNQFVHRLSARAARVLFMMDADILIHCPDTLWNMLLALEQHPEARVAVDLPRKHLAFSQNPSWRQRLSLRAARMTQAAPGQLCAQLYAIRAETARNILLPRDLAACEDGFLKQLVCTDFLTRPEKPERITLAPDAEHTFEAYTAPAALVRNQKRQALGQTIVHVLVDEALKNLPLEQRRNLADTLRNRETAAPDWLKRLIAEHLRRVRFFWRLYPGLLGQRITGWKRLSAAHRWRCLPAMLAGAGATLLGSFLAYRSLKAGCTDYWPRARRSGLQAPGSSPAQASSFSVPASLGRIPK
jgi:Glycosyl transferase family 2